MTYRTLLAEQARFVAAGFALCFFSSFGQTFFIGVFGGAIRTEFGLSHSGFGLLYSLATLTSACSLLWLGRGVDRFDLRRYTAVVCLGLAAACLLMAWTPNVAILFLGILALRLSGQGLMGHIAMTSMARYLDQHRAKAISLAAIGFAAGEAVWPRSAIAALEVADWHQVWLALAGLAVLVVTPLIQWLLRGHDERHRAHLAQLGIGAPGKAAPADSPPADDSPGPENSQRQWSRAEVVRDPMFYLLAPSAIAAPMIVTGMFFHSVRIAEMQGWTMEWYGTCFVGYATSQLLTGLLAGPLVDRFGAVRLAPLLLVPLATALGVLAAFDGTAACPPYLILAGMTTGAAGTVTGTMWAEAYGVLHLGAIRALATAIMVFSTALAPVSMGLMLDAGATVPFIAAAWIGYIALSTLLAGLAWRRFKGAVSGHRA